MSRSRQRVSRARPSERALIGALGQRYSRVQPANRTSLDTAYANAMARVAMDFPRDAEASSSTPKH